MLFKVDKLMRLGGMQLPGLVQSIEVDQEASIDDITDKNKKTKKNQPTGYEGATIRIEIYLEKTKDRTIKDMMNQLQNLFRPYKQKKAKLIKIVNTDCNSRGITRVYFKKLTTTNNISLSYITATLELLAPVFAGIKVKKIKNAVGSKPKKKEGASAKKTKKDSGKSPSKDTRNTEAAKKSAKNLTRK